LLLKSACNIVDPYSRLLIIGFVLLILSSIISICAISPVVAQTPETSSSPQATGLPTIQITSPQDGQQVPPDELSVQGISSDDEDTDCQVYADVNDITPMRNLTAAAASGEDFSKWTFTITQDYQLIKLGENELTAKISCSDNGDFDLNPFPTTGAQATSSSSPLSEWHTVNMTGVTGAPSDPLPLPLQGNTDGSEEDNEENNNDESNDDDDSNNDDGSNNNDDNDDEEDSGNGGGDGNNFFGGDSFFD
jgi:hypothetical protein